MGPDVIDTLTEKEVDACLAAIKDPQQMAIFRLMSEMGLSLSEILGDDELKTPGLYIQDVDSRNLTLRVYYRFVRDSHMEERTVPLPVDCLIAIKDHLWSMGEDLHSWGQLFVVKDRRVRQMLFDLGKDAGLGKKVSPLSLRKYALISLLKSGLKPSEIRKRFGFLREQEEQIVLIAQLFIYNPTLTEEKVADKVVDRLFGVKENKR